MFKRFIDETEIDDWFEEEKKRLQKKYYHQHYKGTGGKAVFEKKMKRLLDRYNREHERLTKKRMRREQMQKPVLFLQDFFTTKKKKMKEWLQKVNNSYKQRRFEKEYRKLMKK